MDQPVAPLTLAELLDHREILADSIDEYNKAAALSIKPTVETLAIVESEIQRLMLEQGGQTFTNPRGANVHWQAWEATKVVDWKLFSDWAVANGFMHMFKADCKKTAVIDFMKENKDALPPGLAHDHGKKLHFRRGTK